MDDSVLLLVGTVFVNHIVLAKSPGPRLLIGGSHKVEAFHVVALATGSVLTLSAALAWAARHGLLAPAGLLHLAPFGFLVAIAVVVQAIAILVTFQNPGLDRIVRTWLPLVAANVIVLGVAALDLPAPHTLITTMGRGLVAALAFALGLVLFAAMRERLEVADVPSAWRGTPIALVTAGLVSLALLGFAGMAPA